MKPKALEDRVLVRPILREKSPLILPEHVVKNHLADAREGVVVSAGELCEYVKDGDKIYYPKQARTEIDVEGKKMLIMRESDVLAIVNQTALP